jgi:hypothetical protein
MSIMKLALIMSAVVISACGEGGTHSGGPPAPAGLDARCSALLKQCRFNNIPGCIAIKQTPEKAAADDLYFAAFCARPGYRYRLA